MTVLSKFFHINLKAFCKRHSSSNGHRTHLSSKPWYQLHFCELQFRSAVYKFASDLCDADYSCSLEVSREIWLQCLWNAIIKELRPCHTRSDSDPSVRNPLLKCPYRQNFYFPIWSYIPCNELWRKNFSIWIKSDFSMKF